MTIHEFLAYIKFVAELQERTGWRIGKCYMSALMTDFPDAASDLLGSDEDPYDINSRVPKFLAHLVSNYVNTYVEATQ